MASWISTVFSPTFLAGMGCGFGLGLVLLPFRSRFTFLKMFTNRGQQPQRLRNKSENESDGYETTDEVLSDEYKLVLVVRCDLKMGKGKVAAQCSHAAVDAVRQLWESDPNGLALWASCGQTKVVTKVNTEAELQELQRAARKKGLVTALIQDAGRTQIARGSRTVLGVGPGPKDLVDEIAQAMKSGCSIVPIRDPLFLYPRAEELPPDMRDIVRYNAVLWEHEDQVGSMNKLMRFIKSGNTPTVSAASLSEDDNTPREPPKKRRRHHSEPSVSSKE